MRSYFRRLVRSQQPYRKLDTQRRRWSYQPLCEILEDRLAPATVITGPATAVSMSGATLNGTVNAGGSPTTVSFEYSTEPAFPSLQTITIAASPSMQSGTTDTPVSATLTTLTAGTLYYDRVVADGTVFATASSFFTEPPPIVTTGPATAVTTSGATLNGTVNPQGTTTSAYFQYSTDPNFTPTVLTTIGSGFNFPEGVAVDAAGDVFVADTSNGLVKEVLPNGTILTIGSGFLVPTGVAVDAAGDVFVTDQNNLAVKEVLPNGTILTIGSGFSGPGGVAVDAAGDVFVADYGPNAVKEVLPNGTIRTIGSGFFEPTGVAVDAAGDVFVADSGHNAVKEVLANGTILTIGSGFSTPRGVAVDAAGDVLVGDTFNNAVKEVLANGTILTIGSGFSGPQGVAVDAAGDVFVAGAGNNRVMEVSPPTVAASPLTQSGSTATPVSAALTGLSASTLYYDRLVAVGPGGPFAARRNSFFTQPPPIVTTGPATAVSTSGATLNGTVNAQGTTTSGRFQYSTDPTFTPTVLTTIGSGFSFPSGVAVDAAGDVFVADQLNNAVFEVLANGTILTIGSGFFAPFSVAVDGAGDVFVADYGNNAVKEVLPNGTILTIGSGFSSPAGVAVDAAGDVFVADYGNSAVKEVLANGSILTIGSGFIAPNGVAVDAAGDVFVTDAGHTQVKEVLPDGTILTIGSGFHATGVAVDAAGDVFVADYSNNRVVEVLPDGTILTIGSGFTTPAGVAVDAAGDVFVADQVSGFVKEVSPPTVAASPLTQTGSTATAVSALLTGLTSGTTYYDRLVAVGPGGTVAAFVSSFTTQATPTLIVNPVSLTYATALNNAQLSGTATAMVNGAPVSVPGTFTYTTAAGLVLNASGTAYTEDVTFTPTDSIDYTTATGTVSVTVAQAVLTVTADNQSKVYGAANPAFTVSYSGFVNGDGPSVLSGSPSLTTSATTASPVGGYAIVPTLGSLSATNYTFIFVNGTLTVNPVVLTVTAVDASRPFGAANPAFTVSYSGFVNGDGPSVLSGSPSLTTSATTASPVGGYAIVSTLGSLSATNYTFIFVNGTLTVNPVVSSSTANLPQNTTTLTINGAGFDPSAANNTVSFNLGAVGTVTSVNAGGTELTVTFTTSPSSPGPLTATVTTDGATSNPVQVATVVVVPPTAVPDKFGTVRDNGSGSLNWFLDSNGDGLWDSGDQEIQAFGYTGDTTFSGNWTGTGFSEAGVARPGPGGALSGTLDTSGVGNNSADVQFANFGYRGDVILVGDWDGSGHDSIAVARPDGQGGFNGTFGLIQNGQFVPGVSFFGLGDAAGLSVSGSQIVVGDWTGSSRDGVAVARNNGQGGLQWFLYTTNPGASGLALDTVFSAFGTAGDTALSGQWTGSSSQVGVFRSPSTPAQWSLDKSGNGQYAAVDAAFFGYQGDNPAVGDWNASGTSKIGVYRTAGGALAFTLDSNGNGISDAGDLNAIFGHAGDTVVVGKWNPAL